MLAKCYFDDIPHAIMHFDYQDEIDFTVCSLPFGTVRLQISLPRTGFCLGEVGGQGRGQGGRDEGAGEIKGMLY